LFASLESWRQTDEALAAVAHQMPAFGMPETLVKVALINSLYFTRALAVPRVAAHFHDVLARVDRAEWTCDTVESLATVVVDRKTQKPKRLISLASNFAHFFMDSHRFPIFDEYAKRSLAVHTGHTQASLASSYTEFCAVHAALCRQVGVQDTPRRLDHYLWVQGQYDAFRIGRKATSTGLTRAFQDGLWPPRHVK
jgi:hypothetical protein